MSTPITTDLELLFEAFYALRKRVRTSQLAGFDKLRAERLLNHWWSEVRLPAAAEKGDGVPCTTPS